MAECLDQALAESEDVEPDAGATIFSSGFERISFMQARAMAESRARISYGSCPSPSPNRLRMIIVSALMI